MNKTCLLINLFFSFFSFCIAQNQASYYFDKDLTDQHEQFDNLSIYDYRGDFILDSIDLVNNISRYVYRYESTSGLKFINTKPTEFIHKAFTIELVFKPIQIDDRVSVVLFKFENKTLGSFPFKKTDIETGYVHYLLTRKNEHSPVLLYVNGKLTPQNEQELLLPSPITSIEFFGHKSKKTQGNVALLKIYSEYFSSKQVSQLISQLPNYLNQREDYTHTNNQTLTVGFLDANTGLPMKANLKVLNGKGELFNSTSAETSFEIAYVNNITYKVVVKPEDKNYMTTIENVTIQETPTSHLIKIKPVSVGDKFELKNIQFKQSEAIMVAGVEEELDYLVALLIDHPNMELLIAGHTDGIGNDELNTELSRLRAMVVEEYLVEKGISRARLTTKGFGGRMPIATNKLDSNRKLNRRVEFTILKL